MGVELQPNVPISQSAVEAPRGVSAKAEAVEALLRDAAQPRAPVSPEGDGQADSEVPAETSGTPEERLYATRVRIRDGIEATVGELKDAFKTKAELDERDGRISKQEADWRADQIATERELQQILSSIDPSLIRPELAQAWETRQRDWSSRERERTLRNIPEWGDARKEQADRAEMTEFLKGYGYAEKDLEQAIDNRLVRLIRDAAKAKQRLRDLEKAQQAAPRKAVEPRKAPAQSAAQQFGALKGQVTRGTLSKVQAVEQLLRTAGKSK